MNTKTDFYWVVYYYGSEKFDAASRDPEEKPRVFLATSNDVAPSDQLIGEVLAELRIDEFPPDCNAITSTQHIIRFVGEPPSAISRAPDFTTADIRAWRLDAG